MTDYKTSTQDTELDIINLNMLEDQARKIIPAGGFGYIRGGAGDEWTMRENEIAFNRKTIVPRVLADLEHPNLSTSILGLSLPMPIMMAPIAAHALAHVGGEVEMARGIAQVGALMGVSTYSSELVEDIAKAGGDAPMWFQLYPRKDDGFNTALLQRAKASGASAIILTADATVGGNREADKINNFVFPFSMPNIATAAASEGKGIGQIYAEALQRIKPGDVEKIAAATNLPVIVKGVQSPEDALLAMGAGASAIYVSNHGGRQLDGGPASFDVLESIADSVAKRVPIIFDSGIRRGQHIFKAIASGADLVAIGRPVLYGLALGGSKGVTSVFRYIARELAMVMQLAGTKTIEDVKNAKLL